jgi:hypothetical protein
MVVMAVNMLVMLVIVAVAVAVILSGALPQGNVHHGQDRGRARGMRGRREPRR